MVDNWKKTIQLGLRDSDYLKPQRFNICFLNARFFPIGGTAIRTLNFARAIKNQVNQISIVTWQPTDTIEFEDTRRAANLIHEGMTFDMMPLRHQFLRHHLRFLYLLTLMVEYATFVRSTVQKRAGDIVHCANDTIWIGTFLKLLLRKPIIADIHAIPYPSGLEMLPNSAKGLKNFLAKVALRILDKSFDGYLTPTTELKELLVSWGLKSDKIKVIPNAVFMHEKRLSREKAIVRAELGIDEKTILIAFHGILLENYNIEALKNLRKISRILTKKLPSQKFKFLIIGFYEKIPVIDENFIYTGFVENLPEYLTAADFALLPIYENSLGIRSRLLDYFMASLPVLTTSVGITGMRFAKNSGAIIIKESTEELAESVIELVNSQEKIKEMSKQSKSLVRWFLPERVAEDLMALYIQIIQ